MLLKQVIFVRVMLLNYLISENFNYLTAYVSGERGGLIQESPYYKGDTLNGRPGLDFEFEKKLIKEKLQDLEAEGANEEAIKYVMRDMGLERYAKQTLIFYVL